MFRTRVAAAAAIAATSVLLAGCASGAGDSTSSGASSASSTSSLHDQLPASITSKDLIVFGGDNHAPYRVLQSDKTVTGLDPDMQAALAKILGVKIRTEIAAGLPEVLTGMQSGRYDAFNGPVKATADREASFDAIVWATSVSSYAFPETESAKIPDAGALCGLSIAGVTGGIIEGQVDSLNTWCTSQGKKKATFLGLADTNSTILAVKSGRAQAVGTTQASAVDIAKNTPGWTYVKQTKDQGAGVDDLALLVPKSNGLGPVLFKAFQKMFADGTYKRIMSKYGIDDVAVAKPSFNPPEK